MPKRVSDQAEGPLKGGDRPEKMDVDGQEMGEFEDEFEDEFESEDEIMEAGVDGRPDAEREAEEKKGKLFVARLGACSNVLTHPRKYRNIYRRAQQARTRPDPVARPERLRDAALPWHAMALPLV